jgi:hypothetical protein
LAPVDVAADEATAPARRRRWLAGSLAVVIVLLLGGAAWAVRYQPLSAGEFGGAGRALPGGGVHPDRDVTNTYGTELTVVRPDEGDHLRLFASLRNDGPAGVRVQGVETGMFPAELQVVRVSVLADDGSATDVSDGFDVPAGAYLRLQVDADIPICEGTRFRNQGTVSSSALIVRYRAFSWEHTATLDLGYTLAIEDGIHCG